jgi:CheY-specific phosphatase CheX
VTEILDGSRGAAHQALRDSVDEVLEKMFFTQTMGECPVDPAEGQGADEIAVSLVFEGEPSGLFLLRLTTAAARQIAADFLGIDEPEVSEIQTSDVIRELSNMICGSVLSRVESAATFQLGAPQIVPASEEIAGSLSNTRYCVQLSNGRLTVNFGTGIPICSQPAQSAY